MIRQLGDTFVLDTDHTTYCFRRLATGQLEHLYYGKKIYITCEQDAEALVEKHAFAPGNTCIYDKEHPQYSLEDMRLEMSAYGKGDIREPFVEIRHTDGGVTNDFVYDSFEILEEKTALRTLPSAYDDQGAKELVVTLRDRNYPVVLELHYSVFAAYDVIVRSAKLKNEGSDPIRLERLMSTQLDFETNDWVFSTFTGGWAREMNRTDTAVTAGKCVNASYTGSSSSRANPFVMLSKAETSEDHGACIGLNLIYSGNHYEACEVNSFEKMRFVSGIHPASFAYQIGRDEVFEAPETVMTYSGEGYNGMSRQMHAFVRECIVRGSWKKKERPVLLNSWEAAYFDISEHQLLRLAKAAKQAGIELFVVDDGWFGARCDDTSSLGDWQVNRKKLPHGLDGLCKKIRALGLDFGIWIEPEMVSVNSELYRAHPEWAMDQPGIEHTEGRNQRILDLANPEVVDYLIGVFSELFDSADISYVKWDMNRIFSDYYSKYLPQERQSEVGHRYILGLYRLMDGLTTRFPDILFEGCAAGGNRFDLGILCYFPQIWASDNTDAWCRVRSMTGYSYGYPMSVVSAHVSSCPNHQTLRITPLETRFHVAAFGVLGYECNLCDLKKEELREIREQIALYKNYRKLLQFGTFYRGRSGNICEWTCVSADRRHAIGMIVQGLVQPNTPFEQYFPKGLDDQLRYEFSNRARRYDIRQFGDLVNTVAPIHVRQDSLLHGAIAKFVTMPGEAESYRTSGSVLMAGVKLTQAFSGSGYNEQTRLFQDFASRMYFMNAKETALEGKEDEYCDL